MLRVTYTVPIRVPGLLLRNQQKLTHKICKMSAPMGNQAKRELFDVDDYDETKIETPANTSSATDGASRSRTTKINHVTSLPDGRIIDGKNTLQSFDAAISARNSDPPFAAIGLETSAFPPHVPRQNLSTNPSSVIHALAVVVRSLEVAEAEVVDPGQAPPPQGSNVDSRKSSSFWLTIVVFAVILTGVSAGVGTFCGTDSCGSRSHLQAPTLSPVGTPLLQSYVPSQQQSVAPSVRVPSLSPVRDASTTIFPVSNNSFGKDGDFQNTKQVPILSLNCGGPTLNMTTTRKTVNSNNETSTRNSTLIWESDVYYNTNYYFGSSRIRSKSNEDSCQDYIIPENNTDAVMMMESIDVFNDRNLDALYCTERFFVDGFGGYEIPVDTVGRYYRVELYMMESFHANINERVFDIIIEDDILVANLDIYAEAGGKHKKFSWVHTVYVSDSSLSIYFNASINYPIVNAISIYYLLQE